MRSQFVTSSDKPGGLRWLPYVFTEQGVAMLSSVLKSKKAIQVNIQIIRTFTKLREMIASNAELRRKLENLEKKYDEQFSAVFKAIKSLIIEKDKPQGEIGFKTK
jgi:phage regulator Rha-like protein